MIVNNHYSDDILSLGDEEISRHHLLSNCLFIPVRGKKVMRIPAPQYDYPNSITSGGAFRRPKEVGFLYFFFINSIVYIVFYFIDFISLFVMNGLY